MPLSEAPVTMASNCSPILDSRRSAAADFSTCRSTLFAASSSCGAMGRQSIQFVLAVGQRLPVEGGFQQALGDQIGVAAIGSGGVGVVLDRKAKVPRRALARKLGDVFARPQELDHGEGQVGEPKRIGGFLLRQELLQRLRIRIDRQRELVFRGDLDDPFPSFRGADHAADRRESLRSEEPSGHTVRRDHEILDDVLGPVLLLRLRSRIVSPSKTGRASMVSRLSAPWSVPEVLHVLRDPVLQAQVLGQPARRR